MAIPYNSHEMMETKPIAKIVCITMGILFLSITTVGFVYPAFMGAHLSMAHNAIHFFSGIFSLWMGMLSNPNAAIRFGLGFGAFYGLLGLVGFVAGHEGSDFMLNILPGRLEFGTADHILHLVISGVYLTSVLLSQPAPKS